MDVELSYSVERAQQQREIERADDDLIQYIPTTTSLYIDSSVANSIRPLQ